LVIRSILITNPPFNIIDKFCARALALLDGGHLKAVVLLYRADKANTQERIEVFNRASYELTVTARSKWLPGTRGDEKSPRWWFTWITWLGGRQGPPVNRRINRAHLSPIPLEPSLSLYSGVPLEALEAIERKVLRLEKGSKVLMVRRG
jgi:hypothetical protein